MAPTYAGCREVIREAFIRKAVPLGSVDIVIASLSESSCRQYDCGLRKWWNFCNNNGVDPFSGTPADVLTFLTIEFKKKASYSSLNGYRSAVALVLGPELGQNHLIQRFFRGVSKLRPANPRYNLTWDPQVVLGYLSRAYPNEDISLERLSQKLVALLALATGHRIQTLYLIDIRNIRQMNGNHLEIKIPDRIKTSGPNRKQPVLRLPFFVQDRSVCVATALLSYLSRTQDLRGSIVRLFISFRKPYKAVSTQTLSRWLKTVLSQSGINIEDFTAYSTRHAATSAAKRHGVSMDIIRKTAGWTKDSETFARFYERELVAEDTQFAKAVFNMYRQA